MCGVFGIHGHDEAANIAYLGMHALQHRGQESAGLVAADEGKLRRHVAMGLVSDAFNRDVLAKRIGVKPGTVRLYDKRGGVQVTVQLGRTEFNAENVNSFRWDQQAPTGAYLEDIRHKLWGARRAEADRLIAEDGKGFYVRRLTSDRRVPGHDTVEEE